MSAESTPEDEAGVGTPGLVSAQEAASRLLDELPADLTARATAALLLTAIETADDVKCTLEKKPPADTQVRPDGDDGDLIRRCEHDPSHCWDLAGSRITCPS